MSKRARSYLNRYPPPKRWTPALAMRRTACRIEDAKAALFDIIAIWNSVDQGPCNDAEDRICDLDNWLQELRKDMDERIAAGEEIGL
ncbi:hypothetical protein [Pararhodobacter sp.]|uniref:hypothetical protein n=1 Tax=Pararhodobacter sp. TaxID=2127056 RepID=UPI002AFFF95A|nr:hypothetical protein [Pararhodobacter sp.]